MHDKVFAKQIKSAIDQKLSGMQKNTRISAVNARLSPLSHVKPDSLKGAFLLEVKDSKLEGISLNVQMSEVKVECSSCGYKFLITNPVFSCSKCNNKDLRIKQAPEFFIESIEIEE